MKSLTSSLSMKLNGRKKRERETRIDLADLDHLTTMRVSVSLTRITVEDRNSDSVNGN